MGSNPATPIEFSEKPSGQNPGGLFVSGRALALTLYTRSMVLRRFSKHIRDQNWVAIGIEFVIVVLGVFLGIEASNWNEARREAGAERATLIRLTEEFGAVEDELARAVAQYETTIKSTGAVITALRAGHPPTEEAGFRQHLRDAQYIWDAPAQSVTYSELVSTGALSRLSDASLRSALTRYGHHAERYARKLPAALGVVLSPDSNYLKAVSWSADPADWDTPKAIAKYDWGLLNSSRAELQSWLTYQADLHAHCRQQLEEIRTVLALLKARR